MFPVMIAAGRPYIGTNTGHKISVQIKLDDPSITMIKGQAGALQQGPAK
jgi:hypothetical protein